MLPLGTTELIIILVIVLLLFGVGRISKIAGEMGRGVRDFRTAMKGDGAADEKAADSQEAA